MTVMRQVRAALVLTFAAAPLAAQADSQLVQAVNAITADGLARHLTVLNADSMRGRDTPSHELERAAQYVADELKQLGLRPFGTQPHVIGKTDTSWFQRYPIPGNLKPNYRKTQLVLTMMLQRGGKSVVTERGRPIQKKTALSFGTAARFAIDTVPESGAPNNWDFAAPLRAYLVAGPQTQQTLTQAALEDKLVVYVPPVGLDTAQLQRIVHRLRASNHVIVLPEEDEQIFAARRAAAIDRSVHVIDRYLEASVGAYHWAVVAQPDSLAAFLAVAGIDVAQARESVTPMIQEIPLLRAGLELAIDPIRKDTATAPNVVAVLPGTGPKFPVQSSWGKDEWEEYILVTAHMDRLPASGDNAAGVAALLELARAFSLPGARPRRSVIFLVTSGSERNLLGSTYWTGGIGDRYPVRLAINLDGLGRDNSSAVAIDGLRDFNFAKRPDWVAAEHPELGLKIVDGGSVSDDPTSDHFAFVRSAVPVLNIHDPVSQGPSSSVATAMHPEQLARVTRLVFYIGREVGGTTSIPGWTSEGRRNRVHALGQ